MKFPGRRQHKHYFPVSEKGRVELDTSMGEITHNIFVVGLDQLLVDIEIEVDDDFLKEHQLLKGQSQLLDDEKAEQLYQICYEKKLIKGEFPGGAVGNTLHNYCVLSDTSCYALGSINRHISVGDYAFRYISKTSSLVDLSYLHPADSPMGRALCFIAPDGERTFAVSKGCMNDFPASAIPEDVITKASAVLISAYTLRDESAPIYQTSIKLAQMAKKFNIPLVFSTGTSSLIEHKKDQILDFIKNYVTVAAMNQAEALALTGIDDPLLAIERLLDFTDLVLLTVGDKGLYMGGLVDESEKRLTKEQLHTKSIVEYNKFEYSRAMRREDCETPVKFYTHINPFKGGPVVIKNTNGAGDAALAAILHDISANNYHRNMVPQSPKHSSHFLSYSSLSQMSKYANRVSFEVLIQNSPRLFKALPQREESLDDEYWSL